MWLDVDSLDTMASTHRPNRLVCAAVLKVVLQERLWRCIKDPQSWQGEIITTGDGEPYETLKELVAETMPRLLPYDILRRKIGEWAHACVKNKRAGRAIFQTIGPYLIPPYSDHSYRGYEAEWLRYLSDEKTSWLLSAISVRALRSEVQFDDHPLHQTSLGWRIFTSLLTRRASPFVLNQLDRLVGKNVYFRPFGWNKGVKIYNRIERGQGDTPGVFCLPSLQCAQVATHLLSLPHPVPLEKVLIDFAGENEDVLIVYAKACGDVSQLRDPEGNSPLHLAVIERKYKLVEYLLERGLSPGDTNSEGKTAADLARSHRMRKLVALESESE